MDEKKTLTTGRRVWLWTAIVISVLVLILCVGGVVGSWVGRNVIVDVADGVLDGVHDLAGVGREGVGFVDGHAEDLRVVVVDVGTAVDEVSQNVADKGLVMTLLPPEKEEKIIDAADRVGEAADTIVSIVGAVVDLIDAVGNIPFVNLPEPDPAKVESLQSDIEAIQAGADQLATDIQAFRDDAAGGIDKVTATVVEVHDSIAGIQDELTAIDDGLDMLQNRTFELKSQIRIWTFIGALVMTLILLWVIYAMVVLIRKEWVELKA